MAGTCTMRNDNRLKFALLIGALAASMACWFGAQTARADDAPSKRTQSGEAARCSGALTGQDAEQGQAE